MGAGNLEKVNLPSQGSVDVDDGFHAKRRPAIPPILELGNATGGQMEDLTMTSAE